MENIEPMKLLKVVVYNDKHHGKLFSLRVRKLSKIYK